MTDIEIDTFGLSQLTALLDELKGPHDDAAAERGADLGLQLRERNRRDEFRLVFEAGYKEGFLAGSGAQSKNGEQHHVQDHPLPLVSFGADSVHDRARCGDAAARTSS